jgi:NhaP-type Na+/H+ and K+/H+ antiporter
VASTITQRSGSRVGVVNVVMQCSIGLIYGEDGYVSIYEYEGTKKNYRKV